MAVTLTDYTLTYDSDQRIQGWPSFYSYAPDWMIGMNNYFYTFYRGELYRHNSNATRNSFYNVVYESTVTTVFNTSPLENKLYKTLALQGAEAWAALMVSDIQTSATIQLGWFERKEQVWFAFVRNQDADVNFALRSVNGIGDSVNAVTTVPAAVLVNFPLTMQVSGIISIGDGLYYGSPTPTFCGTVTAINVNLQAGINQLVVDTTVAGAVAPPIIPTFFLYVKNAIAESHGVLGHYATTTLTHPGTTQAELFAVQSGVMKSYP